MPQDNVPENSHQEWHSEKKKLEIAHAQEMLVLQEQIKEAKKR
jgi:hypothetical protein